MNRDQLFDSDFLRKLELLAVLAKKILRGDVLSHRLNIRKGASVEFLDHRVYSSGDDLRYLDWNVYGRLGSMFIKRFSAEEHISIKLFLDCSASMDFGKQNKFVYARRLVAALAYIGICSFDHVEVLPFADGQRYESFNLRSKKHFLGLLTYLADLKAQGSSEFRKSFMPVLPLEHGRRVALMISDFMDQDAWDYPVKRLKMQKIMFSGIHLMDDLEQHPPQSGQLRLTDQENGQVLELAFNKDNLKLYNQELERFCREIERVFLQQEASYLRVNTATPFEDIVLSSFRHAGILTGQLS